MKRFPKWRKQAQNSEAELPPGSNLTDKERKLIKEKLFKKLEFKGLEAMNSMGEPFDADLHEAITEIPAPTEELKGKIVDVIEEGYTLNKKIIRYAKVVVGK